MSTLGPFPTGIVLPAASLTQPPRGGGNRTEQGSRLTRKPHFHAVPPCQHRQPFQNEAFGVFLLQRSCETIQLQGLDVLPFPGCSSRCSHLKAGSRSLSTSRYPHPFPSSKAAASNRSGGFAPPSGAHTTAKDPVSGGGAPATAPGSAPATVYCALELFHAASATAGQ